MQSLIPWWFHKIFTLISVFAANNIYVELGIELPNEKPSHARPNRDYTAPKITHAH